MTDFVAIIMGVPSCSSLNRHIILDELMNESAPTEMIGNGIVKTIKILRKMNEVQHTSPRFAARYKTTCSNLTQIVYLSCKLPQKLFKSNAVPIARAIEKEARGKQWFEELLYRNIIINLRNARTSAPNGMIQHHATYLLLIFCPNLPTALQRSEFDNEFYSQFQLLSSCLKNDDSDIRHEAFGRFTVWIREYWSSLVDHQLSAAVDMTQLMVANMLHTGSPDCQIAAIRAIWEVISGCPMTHQFLSALLEGDENYEDRKSDSINVSELISSSNAKVRSEFVALLRVCNKTTHVKWSHICDNDRVLKQFEVETNRQTQNDIACLLRYQYFKVNADDDKQGVITTLMKLRRLYEQYPVAAGKLLTIILQGWDQSDSILIQLIRKSGHSVMNWINERDNDNDTDDIPSQHSASLCISATIWRCSTLEKLLNELVKATSPPNELLKTTALIWKEIITKLFTIRNCNDDVKVAILAIAPIFSAGELEQILVPLRSEVKRGTINPHLVIQDTACYVFYY